jgi:hypothetical protein
VDRVHAPIILFFISINAAFQENTQDDARENDDDDAEQTENYTGCFKKSFTTFKAYINLFRGHVQCF